MLGLGIVEKLVNVFPALNWEKLWDSRNVEKPVRPIESSLAVKPIAWLYRDGDARRIPVGMVYPMPDGRQAYAPVDGHGDLVVAEAKYLKKPLLIVADAQEKDSANFLPESTLPEKGDLLSTDMQKWLLCADAGQAFDCDAKNLTLG